VAAATAFLGCDQGNPELSPGGKGPAPHVVWKYPWTYAGPGDVGMETRGVPLQTTIRVQFDRFLAPDSAIRQSICVQSCSVGPGAQCDGQCLGGLSPEYDPIDRVVVWKSATLVAGLRYNVRLLVPKDDNDLQGVRAIDGTPLDKEYTFAFTAGDPTKMAGDPDAIKPELVAAESVVAQRTAINFCSTSKFCPVPTMGCATPDPDPAIRGPQQTLQSCAAGSGCHGAPTPPVVVPPAAPPPRGSVFSLIERNGGVPAAVIRLVGQGVVATESAVGPDPSLPRRSPKDVFGVNMPYLDAKNPGNSYVIYKVLLGMAPRCGHVNEESANPNYADQACTGAAQLSTDEFLCSDIQCLPEAGANRPNVDGGPPAPAGKPSPPLVPAWIPDDRWTPPADGEFNRLRTRIRGDGMAPGQPTPYQDAHALSAWIAAGASATCPATP
jgi:hypothetical protein